jgi:hypothetical protein
MAFLCAFSSAQAAQVRLGWVTPTTRVDGTPLNDLAGYNLYYWQPDWSSPAHVNVGKQTTYTLTALEAGRLYLFAVTAYDASENESESSSLASVTMPLPGTNTARGRTSGDGLARRARVSVWGINPYDVDADNDGFDDVTEVSQGSDPDDPTSMPAQVQLTVEAEDYNTGGEGVGYHDLTAANACGAYRQGDVDIQRFTDGGFFICQIRAGDLPQTDRRWARQGTTWEVVGG